MSGTFKKYLVPDAQCLLGNFCCPANSLGVLLPLGALHITFRKAVSAASPERGGAAKGGGGVQPDDRPHASRSLGRIAAAGWSAEGEGSPGDFRSSARRHDLRTPTGGRRRVGRLCRSKAMDCLVEALTGNVRQARLMKNTPPLRGAFRLPFATAHGPSVPAPSGQPPL